MTVLEKPLVMDDVVHITIFIYEGMERTGGIQSIVIRQVERIHHTGGQVFVVCSKEKDAPGLRPDTIVSIHSRPKTMLAEIVEKSNAKRVHLDIVSLSPEAAPVGYLIQYEALKLYSVVDARLCLTILHPRDLMRETERVHLHLMNKLTVSAIDAQNLVFMNDQCRATHSTFLGQDLSSNPIVPVPIDAREPRWKCRSDGHEVRIVSIGRIVGFKAYNFALPAFISEVKSLGWNVSCDIYGYGPEEDRLKQLISEYGVENRFGFHGPIELDLFDDIVSDYDLFIGMGTAALQAAQLGVPTILAIVDDGDGAHGFIDAVPFGNLGEQDINIRRRELKELIESFVLACKEEREKISQDGIAYANRYLAEDYVTRLTKRSVRRTGPKRHLAALYCRFYIWMAKDNWLRQTVRFTRTRMKFFGRS